MPWQEGHPSPTTGTRGAHHEAAGPWAPLPTATWGKRLTESKVLASRSPGSEGLCPAGPPGSEGLCPASWPPAGLLHL